MPRPASATPPAPRLPWRSVALPIEHGGWGFLAEPAILGLAMAPSLAGLALAAAALFAFLARHPLRLALLDRRRRVRYPRTALAERFVLGYGLVAAGLLALAVALARQPFWPAVVAALPFAAAALWFDVTGRSREAVPELAGAAALASSAAAIALSGGAPATKAAGAATLLALRAISSVLYVRARIRLDRGLPAGPASAVLAHALALVAAAALAWLGWGPWLGIAAFAVLLARAAWGLSPRRQVVPARVVGVQELQLGLLTLALLALGYRLHA